MASFSKLIEGKTPIINQIIAHANVSDEIFILPEKPLNKNYDKNMTRNLKALYFSMSRSDKKDLFLGDLYKMILPNYVVDCYLEFFNFVKDVYLNKELYDKNFIDEIGMSACHFYRHSPEVAPIVFAAMGLNVLSLPFMEPPFSTRIAREIHSIFMLKSNFYEVFAR